MDRLACVDLPALPLQLLGRRHPEWKGAPAAVVARDAPQGEILCADAEARRLGVSPGQRYGTALALCPQLRAGTVPAAEVSRAAGEVADLLARFSPGVEPSADAPGVFWLAASGLERLHDSATAFARTVRAALREIGFEASVAVGFSRFGAYALARSVQGAVATRSPEEERAAAGRTALAGYDLPPSARGALARLGVVTIAQLLALPPDGLLTRFGPEVHALALLARGDAWRPLAPRAPSERFAAEIALDYADADAERLGFLAKGLLDPILARLAARREAVAELELRIDLDHHPPLLARLRPAAPTLDARVLVELVRLRLEATELGAGAVGMALEARAVEADPEQLRLFAERGRRDLDAANRALARLRAELGDAAVVRARLTEGHLPEAQFAWEPLDRAVFPSSGSAAALPMPLVRRIRARPTPLGTRPAGGPQGIHLGGLADAPVSRADGPYVISGGWWQREVHREYYFAKTKNGRILWVYFDRRRRRWFLHGEVA
ncbi:MAG: DNA polymerase Y family protein [Proteobacteria bacterium]|nr:DNA polymerase Y family protein [Pseudomonadota bacterium]